MKISMKKRKIGYTYGTSSGVYSFRNEKSILFESPLERDFIQLMDHNSNVMDIEGQPFTLIDENFKGNKGNYTPYFLVYFKTSLYSHIKTKPLLVEVKPSANLKKDWKNLKPKFKKAIKYSKEQDYRFKIFTESIIRTQEFYNITFLNRYKDYSYNIDDIDIILNHLKVIGQTTLNHLIAHLFVTDFQKGNAIGIVWHLVSLNVISCDLSLKLTNNTVLWLNNNEENYLGILDGS
jgi:hypothetical protein